MIKIAFIEEDEVIEIWHSSNVPLIGDMVQLKRRTSRTDDFVIFYVTRRMWHNPLYIGLLVERNKS